MKAFRFNFPGMLEEPQQRAVEADAAAVQLLVPAGPDQPELLELLRLLIELRAIDRFWTNTVDTAQEVLDLLEEYGAKGLRSGTAVLSAETIADTRQRLGELRVQVQRIDPQLAALVELPELSLHDLVAAVLDWYDRNTETVNP